MREGACIRCLKGTMYNCAAVVYVCDHCGYQEPTLLASDLKVEGMTVWAAAQLEKWNDRFAVRPTQIFSNYLLSPDKTYQQLADRAVYAAPVVEQVQLFDTTDHISFGGRR